MDKNDYLLLHDESVDCNTINRCLYAIHKSINDKLDAHLNQKSANIPSHPFFKDGINNALTNSSLSGYGLVEASSVSAGVVRRLFTDDISKTSFNTTTPAGLYTYDKDSISEFVPSVKALFTDKSTSLFSSVFATENGTFQSGEKTLVTIAQPKIKYNSYILFGDIGVAFGTITLSRTNADSQNLYLKVSIIDDLICRNNIDSVKFLTITNGYASGIREISENLDMVSEINSASIIYLTDDEIVIHNITKNDSSDNVKVNKSTYRIVEDDFIDENSLKDEYLTIDNSEYSLNYFCLFKTRDMMSEYTFNDWCFYIIKNDSINKTALSNAIKWAYHNTTDTFSNFRFADAGSYKPEVQTGGPYITSSLIENASDAFNGCYNATLENLSGFSSNLKYADRMFKSCTNATFDSLPTELTFNKLNSAQSMFENCNVALFSSLVSLIIPNANKLCNMFNNCPKAEFAQLVNLFIAGDCSKMFYNCRSASFNNLEKIEGNIYSTASMFNGCADATFANLISVDSSYNKEVDASNMFAGNEIATFEKLQRVEMGESCNSTSMFEGCINATLTSLVSIGRVTTSPYMFKNCYKATLERLPTSSLETVRIGTGMFDNCNKLSMDISSLPDLYNGEYMFRNTQNITVGNVNNLSLANSMFYSCGSVKIIGEGDNSSLTDATNMCRYSNDVTIRTKFNNLVDATHMCSDCKEKVEFEEIPSTLTEMDEMFSNTATSLIYKYTGNAIKPRFATNAFYKNDTVIIRDGNLIEGNLYDASQMFYGVKHLTLGNSLIRDGESETLSARYGFLEKTLPYTIINEHTDDENKTSIYRDISYNSVSSSISTSIPSIGIGSKLSVGDAQFDIYYNTYVTIDQTPTLSSISIPYNSYTYYQNINVYNHDLYGKYATTTQSFGDNKDILTIATDNSDYVSGDDAIVYSLSAQHYPDGNTVKWDVKDTNRQTKLFTISCGEYDDDETKSYLVKVNGTTIYETNIDFADDCYLTVNYVVREINSIYRICPMFIINIGNGMTTGVVYDNISEGQTLFKWTGEQDIETVYTTGLNGSGSIDFIKLLDSYGSNIEAYIYEITLVDNKNYHIIYTRDNTNLITSFLYSEIKDTTNTYEEIQDYFGNLMSFSVVTYTTDLVSYNRKQNVLIIEESELPNNLLGLSYANRMFYNVKSPNLFNCYDKLITKKTINTDQMFKINLEGDTEHNLYDETDFTTVDSVDETNTFYKCGRIFKDMKDSSITSAYEMFKNRWFANEFPFYSEGTTNKDRKANLSIPNGLINGTGMFENCRIYHSNEFNNTGTILQLSIPPSLRYGDRMFKNFNRISDTDVVPNVELRLGDYDNPNIYISDNLSCDEMFAGCKFNNNDITIPLTMSFPNVNTYLFEGSNFNFNNVRQIEFRKNNFGTYHENDRKFFTETTTFGLLQSDISKWFNEGVQLLTVLNSHIGSSYNLEIGYDESSDFRNAIMNVSNKGRYDKYYSRLVDSVYASSEPYNSKSFKLNNIREISGDRIACMFNPSMLYKYSTELTDEIKFKVLKPNMSSSYEEVYDFDGIDSITLFVEDEKGNKSWKTIQSNFLGHVNALAVSGGKECYLSFPRDTHYLGDKLHEPMKYVDTAITSSGFDDTTIGKTYSNIEFNRLEHIASVEMPYAFSGLPNATFRNLKMIDGSVINAYSAFEECSAATFENLEKVVINHTINEDAYSNAYLKTNVEDKNWVGNFSNMFRNNKSATFENLNTLSIYSNSKELPNGDVFNYYYDANGDLVVNAIIIQEPELKISHVTYEENGEYVLNFNTMDTDTMRLSNDLLSVHTGLANGSVTLSAYGSELIKNDNYNGDDKNLLLPSKTLLTVFAHVSGYPVNTEESSEPIEKYFLINNGEQVYEYDTTKSFNLENEFRNPTDDTSSLRYLFKEVTWVPNYKHICNLSTLVSQDGTTSDGKPVYTLNEQTASKRSIMLYKQSINEYASSIVDDDKNTTSSFYKIRVDESDDDYVTITFSDYEGIDIASIHTLLSDDRYESKVEFSFYMNEQSGNICIMAFVRETYNKTKYYFLTENGFLQEFDEKPNTDDYFYIGSLQYDTRIATIHNYCDSLFEGCSAATFKNLEKMMICGFGSCRNLFNGCISEKITPDNDDLSIIKFKYFLLPTTFNVSKNGMSYRGVFRGCVMNRFDFSSLNKISTNMHILGEHASPTIAKSLFDGICDGEGDPILSKDITPELINSLTGLSFSVLKEMDFETEIS